MKTNTINIPIGQLLVPPLFCTSNCPNSSEIKISITLLKCDGQEVNRKKYDKLFKIIGENYGKGNGVTTFNLPNLRSGTEYYYIVST
jgi:hypothetical protein